MAVVRVVDNEQLDEELKQVIREAYDDSAKDENFFVGVSGGSLPKMLVRVLKQMDNIDWKKWLFFFCDERVVPSDSEESTFGTYKRLLEPPDQRLPLCFSQFVAIDPALKSKKVAEDYLSKVRQRFDNASNMPRFHILFLGLGPDGHTCSLFPGHRLLKETKWIAYIEDSPKPPPERITMTLPVLNNAKYCVFVATGENKAEVIKEILVDKKQHYPAALVQPHAGKLIWLMDKAAGSLFIANKPSGCATGQ